MPTLVDDELWQLLEPLLPRPPRRSRHPGRRRLDDRKVFSGILFVLSTGIAWQRLPQELGYGSGMNCWRRLHEWQQAGVFQHLHEPLLDKLRQAGRLDLSRAV
jgi:transposase